VQNSRERFYTVEQTESELQHCDISFKHGAAFVNYIAARTGENSSKIGCVYAADTSKCSMTAVGCVLVKTNIERERKQHFAGTQRKHLQTKYASGIVP
jgi:hypothetical protein